MPLLLLRQLLSKNALIAALAAALLGMALLWHQASTHLKEVQAVYKNPEVKTVERVVYKEGPVHVVTRTIREPSGTVTTETTVDRAPTEKTIDKGTEKKPVPISTTMAEARTDRYLITVGLNRLTPDFDGKALFIGYSIHNRFDVQAGGIEHNGFSPWVLATMRF